MAKRFQQPYFVQNVEGLDEDVTYINCPALNQIISSSFSNVENVHLEFGNVTLLDVVDVS
jgi:hypothetical protein